MNSLLPCQIQDYGWVVRQKTSAKWKDLDGTTEMMKIDLCTLSSSIGIGSKRNRCSKTDIETDKCWECNFGHLDFELDTDTEHEVEVVDL